MRILGIETSCDETGVALYDSEQGLLGHVLHTQAAMHAKYGGVVPELASRDHIQKLTPSLQQLFDKTRVSADSIDAIAYTAGPGLIGALLIGATYARALGLAWGIPSIPVHHMEAHLLAPFLEPSPSLHFPFTALLVSGGHTLLMNVKDLGKYELLGESIDDAAGEAFDKTAKCLHLSYPGGPAVAELAKQGIPNRFILPRPMLDRPGLDFSFSGLKTAVIQLWEKTGQTPQDRADIAHAFQEAITDTLMLKCKRALKKTLHSRLVVAGGVGANLVLRTKLNTLMTELGGEVFYPRLEFCTDNGAMIAYTGYRMLKAFPERFQKLESQSTSIDVFPRWSLS